MEHLALKAHKELQEHPAMTVQQELKEFKALQALSLQEQYQVR
jgi:hypothetical protein